MTNKNFTIEIPEGDISREEMKNYCYESLLNTLKTLSQNLDSPTKHCLDTYISINMSLYDAANRK